MSWQDIDPAQVVQDAPLDEALFQSIKGSLDQLRANFEREHGWSDSDATQAGHTKALNQDLQLGNNKITGLQQATNLGEAVAAGRQVNTGTGLTGGGNLTENRTIEQVERSVIQRVDVQTDGGSFANESRIEFIGGDNISITQTTESTPGRIRIRIDGGGAASQSRRLQFSEVFERTDGNPLGQQVDLLPCVVFLQGVGAEIQASFIVPPDYRTDLDGLLSLQFRGLTAPGGTNRNVQWGIRHAVGSGSFTSVVSDTFQMDDNTNWQTFAGTDAKIPAASLAAGNLVLVRISRIVPGATPAAVDLAVAAYGMIYTSAQ